jgi:riboflavin synthase
LCDAPLPGAEDEGLFTGIVETTAKIVETRAASGGRRLRIEAPVLSTTVKPGASICVSGVCLTVAANQDHLLDFDVIAETIRKSTLGEKRVGDRVNLERSLRVGDRIDGHFVQGHVDGTALVDRVLAQERVVWFRADPSIRLYVIPKGSIAVDGVSLTIADVDRSRFCVALIPTTLERTTLAALTVGDRVNIETDMLVRAVLHQQSPTPLHRELTLESLREAGLS